MGVGVIGSRQTPGPAACRNRNVEYVLKRPEGPKKTGWPVDVSALLALLAGLAYVLSFWHTQQVLIMGRLPLSLFYALLPLPFYFWEGGSSEKFEPTGSGHRRRRSAGLSGIHPSWLRLLGNRISRVICSCQVSHDQGRRNVFFNPTRFTAVRRRCGDGRLSDGANVPGTGIDRALCGIFHVRFSSAHLAASAALVQLSVPAFSGPGPLVRRISRGESGRWIALWGLVRIVRAERNDVRAAGGSEGE